MYLGLGVDATYSNTISNASYSRTKKKSTKTHTYGAITLYGMTIPSQLQLNKSGP